MPISSALAVVAVRDGLRRALATASRDGMPSRPRTEPMAIEKPLASTGPPMSTPRNSRTGPMAMTRPWLIAIPTSSTIAPATMPTSPTIARNRFVPLRSSMAVRRAAIGLVRDARNAGHEGRDHGDDDADEEDLEHAGGAQARARRRPIR